MLAQLPCPRLLIGMMGEEENSKRVNLITHERARQENQWWGERQVVFFFKFLLAAATVLNVKLRFVFVVLFGVESEMVSQV